MINYDSCFFVLCLEQSKAVSPTQTQGCQK